MKIEVRKKYIDAEGDIVEIVKSENINYDYPFMENEGTEYTESGLYLMEKETPYDLICEVNEDIYTEYKQDLITKEDFWK